MREIKKKKKYAWIEIEFSMESDDVVRSDITNVSRESQGYASHSCIYMRTNECA